MKKVGVVTLHRAWNYGAKLQAYALVKKLGEKYDSGIVDYRCAHIENQYYKKGNKIARALKLPIKFILQYPVMKIHYGRKKKFEEFDKKHLITNSKIYNEKNIKDAVNDYDAFVAGSDQVWNTDITGNDYNYFLDFAPSDMRYSYAASFGDKAYNDEEKELISSQLKNFNSVLLREKTGVEFAESLNIGRKIEQVSDPVFLLSKDEWIESLGLERKENEKYIFVYLVAKDDNLLAFAKAQAKKMGCGIKYVNWDEKAICPDGMTNVKNVGPVEFLQNVLGASLVLTTSFHGMAFSVIFNKPFYYELSKRPKNNNSRLCNLAEIFNLYGREITSADARDDEFGIDWDKVNPVLREYSENSKKALLNSLTESGGVER